MNISVQMKGVLEKVEQTQREAVPEASADKRSACPAAARGILWTPAIC